MNKNRGFDNAQARAHWRNPQKHHSCGVQSLHHALLLLGKPSDLAELLAAFPLLDNIAFGHEVPPLISAARRFGGRPEDITSSDLRALRATINRILKGGSPIILGSDARVHWLVLAGLDGQGGYVWIDSFDQPLSGAWDWDGIEEWLLAADADGERSDEIDVFEAIAIHPRKNDNPARSMVPHIAGIYELLGSNEKLAGQWGSYLDDLDKVFNFQSGKGPRMEAETFFENNGEAIALPVLWMDQDGLLEKEVVQEVLRNYRTVANFHSLELPACYESHAVAHMAMILRDRVL
jgi:hypothetical protein